MTNESAVLRQSGVKGILWVMCPGCKMEHHIHTREAERVGPKWDFDGNYEAPTFSPSLLVTYTWGPEQKQNVCHSFIRKGFWEFLGDCTHEHAGKTIPLINADTEYD